MDATAPPRVVIALSKRKILLLLLLCGVFVAVSSWLWSIAETQTRYEPLLAKGVSLLGVVFFGIGGVVAVRKLVSQEPGLVLDEQGIWLPGSIGAPSLIPWQHVQGFEVMELHRTKVLLVLVNNTAELLAQQRGWKQQLLRMNLQQYGTPYSITSNTLKIGFDELVQTVTERFRAVKG
ncbi:hypothetical protein LJ737_17385 [Hymenobacter sp. 15J16-1T3B]|uniref:STM3941 family protein n=1 Tax=Hymenobacter sp. 15J16-1T3B TaxID=2886941 RepID=UPI001D11D444|nr:STM3941 family protein [Hymenobacter sp. 15J16-1T3B]MCC3159020.1 hypothetical protein [Hymenobacter sp. 15J16-1T3B]